MAEELSPMECEQCGKKEGWFLRPVECWEALNDKGQWAQKAKVHLVCGQCFVKDALA